MMSSPEHLDALRRRNKELLLQLKQQTERLQSVSGTTGFTEGADHANTTAQGHAIKVSANGITLQVNTLVPLLPQTEVDAEATVVTLVDGDRGSARAALSRPAQVHFKERGATTTEIHTTPPVRSADEARIPVPATVCTTSTPSLAGARHEHGQAVAGHSEYSRQLRDGGNSRSAIHVRSMDVKRQSIRPRERREAGKVTFHSPGQEQTAASDRHHLQPLLGYDWIAGLLDAESSMTERSEEFFSDLRTFRQVNRDECVHRRQEGLAEETFSPQPLSVDKEDTVDTMVTHQCTFCYRINSRLFPAPLDSQESCPVCKMPKSKHPHTVAEPAFIRVSIPRSTLLPAYQYKAHRRCSFDPSDSLGLPSHCLSGMANRAQGGVSQPSSLDLRSALNTTAPPTGLPPAPHTKDQLDVSVSRVSGSQRSDQLLNVSRLTRYRFQRPAPSSKPPSSTYPVY